MTVRAGSNVHFGRSRWRVVNGRFGCEIARLRRAASTSMNDDVDRLLLGLGYIGVDRRGLVRSAVVPRSTATAGSGMARRRRSAGAPAGVSGRRPRRRRPVGAERSRIANRKIVSAATDHGDSRALVGAPDGHRATARTTGRDRRSSAVVTARSRRRSTTTAICSLGLIHRQKRDRAVRRSGTYPETVARELHCMSRDDMPRRS